MNEITPLDEAQLRHEMRDLFKHAGYNGAMQALYEILVAGRILSEIIVEEMKGSLRNEKEVD